MIALVPRELDLDRLALDGGEPRDELHLTLWFLGDAIELDADLRERLPTAIASMIERRNLPVVHARAFGAAHWNPTSDDPAWVLNVGDVGSDAREPDGDALAVVRETMREAWTDGGVPLEPPPQHTPWQPHVCVAYSTDDLLVELESRLGDVTFDRVRVAFGGDVTDLPLAQPATVAAALGGDVMPWHTVEGHAECADGQPWAVVKDATGEVEGCHASQADANAQLAALYASENDASAGDVVELTSEVTVSADVQEGITVTNPVTTTSATSSTFTRSTGMGAVAAPLTASTPVTLVSQDDCPPGQHRMPDGSCMSDDEMYAASTWEGPLVVEGTPTGDGREFAVDALSWVEGALLRWQKEGSHGGDHDVTVSVGRIDQVWRDGNIVVGRGVLDLLNPDGFELRRRMAGGFAGGISIDADDIQDADVEFVWGDDYEDELADEDGNLIKLLFGRPEKMIYHGGRVRAATVCDIPAFVEARIALTNGEPVAVTASVATPTLVVERHDTETSDAEWTPPKHTGMTRVAPLSAYAWGNEHGATLLHHELTSAGETAEANLTACAAALAQLADPTLDVVPAADRRAVYEHLAAHLRAAGREPPPLPEDVTLVAASVAEVDDWRPVRGWFENPGLTVPVGITVTDQGRVYGHVAQWGECHIGNPDVCVTPPEESLHSYFMTGEVVCAAGERVAVGQITVGTGHAPLSYRASHAAEHYDNTGVAAADVVVGNDEIGIWCAGAIRPFVEAARVHELRASGQVSGDWRRIGGALRLVGLLAVNVPGFPVPRLRARVASGVPQALVAAGRTAVGSRVVASSSHEELDRLAMRRVMDMLAARVRRVTENEGVH